MGIRHVILRWAIGKGWKNFWRDSIFVAALALLLQRLLERRLQEAGVPLSAAQALEAVATVRHVTFRVGTEQRSGVSLASPQAAAVLKGLGITNTRPPTPPAGEATVM